MVGLLPCPLTMRSKTAQDSDHRSISTVHPASYSSSSLGSQSSLQSVPSLTLPSSSSSAAAAAAYYHCLATLSGHSSYVFSLAIAGKYLYSGASDGELRLWVDRNPNSFNSPQNRAVYDGAVKSIAVSSNKIFTAHHDHRIRVWKIDGSTDNPKHKLVTTLPTMSDRFMRLFSAGNYVRIRRHQKRTWVHHVDAVSALALSRDGSLLYSVSWDRTLKVWDTSNFKCLESIQSAHDDAINAVVLSSDGMVYTGSADKRIKVWRKPGEGEKRHALISTLEKHKSAVNALALTTDGSILYSGACDRSIVVWEKEGGASHMAVSGALRGHTKAILCLAVVADLVCSGSADGTVRIWRRGIGNYSCLGVFEGHASPVKCLAAGLEGSSGNKESSGDSYLVYSGSLDYEIKVWKIWVPLE